MTDAALDLATVWDQIRERLAKSLSPQQNAMLNLTRPLGLVEDTAVLAAPNEFTQTVLESRMRRVLAEALSEQFGRDIRVAVQLEDAPEGPPSEDADQEPTRRARSSSARGPRRTGPPGTGPTTGAVPSASGPTRSAPHPGTATAPRVPTAAPTRRRATCARPR
jgi:chromosomal replication initiation ATPase DnaA